MPDSHDRDAYALGGRFGIRKRTRTFRWIVQWWKFDLVMRYSHPARNRAAAPLVP